MNILNLAIIIPVLTAFAAAAAPKDILVKRISLAGSILLMLATGYIVAQFAMLQQAGSTEFMKMTSEANWFNLSGIKYSLGLNSISVLLLFLSSVILFTGILVSWDFEGDTKLFFGAMLFLATSANGFFISKDIFLMFFFLELAIVPKFLLIAKWGSGNRMYSAFKLSFMLMAASSFILVGLLYIHSKSGIDGLPQTWDVTELMARHFPIEVQRIFFVLTFTGFGVFTALFPFHTWVPDGHSSAPTAGSMFLAGISMKLGGYGSLVFAAFIAPDAAREFSNLYIVLGAIAIIYGAFATLFQKDLKYMNAYSSVSHCGFVVLGVAALTRVSVLGAVMQMVSHGLITALFFALIGMIYGRTHTRQINEMGGLMQGMPFLGTAMFIVGLASLGLPGLSGFVSEMTVLTGSWQNPSFYAHWAVILAGASIVVTSVYILRALGKVLWGQLENAAHAALPAPYWYEKILVITLIGLIAFIGMYPVFVTDIIDNGLGMISLFK